MIPFFEKFSKEKKRFIFSMDCNVGYFKDRQFILSEGELDDSFYIILGGAVRVSRENPDGPELRKSHTRKRSGKVSKLKPGTVFGELSFVNKRPRSSTLLSEDEVSLIKMDGAMIERLNPVLLN